MSGRLPQIVHPGRLAESGASLRGTVALNTLPRLAGYLHDTEGEVNVELEFGIDVQKIRFVQGRLSGTLHLICQRCLQSLAYPVDLDVALGLAWSEAGAEKLPGHYEPLIVDEARLELARLVEDELMLALPVVPMHAIDECRHDRRLIGAPAADEAAGQAGTQDTRRPFAGLGELLRDKNQG